MCASPRPYVRRLPLRYQRESKSRVKRSEYGRVLGHTAARKLGIKEGARLGLVDAPDGFRRALGSLPPGVDVRTQARGRFDVIVVFATRAAPLERRFPALARALEPAGGLWVAWPKQASGVPTELSFESVQR